ncbi:putative Xaa-Pro aminopeptidase P [Gossypium arboreum]|uniref:Putative Xaa-Pro aminopeptidase P n=1 Tax=Gossypium arboreum TaxID=29729 RepID=A0A0B0PDD9_GOSAR|nr:putative Xaa-Pro aminopeptidase P [Gossypium arboreum]
MADILASLRSLMASQSPPLDALLVPSEDYHQSEYVSARDKRREFVSGFTGSAGLALITKNEARLWTDGRYFLQATQQLSDQWKLMRIGEDPPVDAWMSDNLQKEAAIGIDPWCVSVDTAQRWERAFAKKNQKLVQTSTNLIDEIWKNRPPAEINPAVDHPLEFAGRSVAEKLKALREKLSSEKARGIIITTLDEVAWLYNIRGSDVSYSPVVHAFAIVTLNSAFLYLDKRKVSSSLQANGIEVRQYGAVSSDAAMLASNQLDQATGVNSGQNGVCQNDTCDNDLIWVDPASCCYALFSRLDANKLLLQQSPLALAKALKNPVELDGLKNAHIRDGAAVVQYLVWLDKQMQEIYGASGYFLEGEHFRGLSFPTISSVGPNAAIIHYSPQAKTCAELDPNSIYLFDSGAQYLDGTTDITRTVHFGKPSAHEKACYTSVLKGHIALGNARFPNGTNGPHQISFRPQARNVPLQVSMTVTDAEVITNRIRKFLFPEPGYYEDGNFGIRLENVLVIKEADTEFNFSDKGYLSFEHITWAPYQIKLIDLSILTPEEIQWLNRYHLKCREILGPYLDTNEMEWLKKATEPVSA